MAKKGWLNWPNRLTMLRIILIGPFVILLLNINSPDWPWARHLAIMIFLAMAISDGLDGWLARKFDEETRLGRFLDPVADKLLITCAMILLGIPETAIPGFKFPSWVVVAAIGKDLFVVVGFLLVFLETGKVFIKPSIIGKACTATQMILLIITLLAPDLCKQSEMGKLITTHTIRFLWLATTILAILTCWDYFRSGMNFAETDKAETNKPNIDVPDIDKPDIDKRETGKI